MRFFCLWLGFILAAFSVSGQKVTLVLSGGGAKGLAHVGVIKALEEYNIPVDFVAGTSMGGVIAGCYAAGFSADEIEQIILSDEFLSWVNGEIDDRYEYYFYQSDIRPSIVSAEFSLDSAMRASVTSSLASDLALNFALAEKLAQPIEIAGYNFDSLFVPARIVASDIFTQTEVVLDSGSLSSALRTSLSVPFFYKPIRIGGKYLFDGGIYNNFPVDVASREFDADVIIGVNVASKVYNQYPYEEDDQLLSQSLLFMLLDKSDPGLVPETGIYLEPDLEGYTAFDFRKAEALIDSGYQATIRQIGEIRKKIARSESAESRLEKRKIYAANSKPLNFGDIVFHGFNSKQRKYLSTLYGFARKDQLTLEELKKGYYKMVSEPFFRTIYPDIVYDTSKEAYTLHLYGRPRSNLTAHVGGVIASRNISQAYLGAEYYYFDNYLLKLRLDVFAGSFYKSARVRSRMNLSSFQPVYIEPDLTFNQWDYLDADDIFFQEKDPTILNSTDRKYGLNIGFPVTNRFKGVLSASWLNNDHQFSNSESVTSADTLDTQKVKGYRFGFKVTSNSLNRRQYASEGYAITLGLDYFDLQEQYTPGTTSELINPVSEYYRWFRLKGSIEQYFLKGKYSTGYIAEGVISNQPYFATYTGTLINAPAFYPMQDSRTLFLQNFRGFNYLAGGVRNILRINKVIDFRLEGYLFKTFEALNHRDDQPSPGFDFNNEVSFAATAGLVMHTPLGPVSLSANYYDDEENQFGMLLHLGFLLHGDKSLE